ncbi:PhzF family phenazine biosynthesis protein [uncultured Paraglaciecola sp.]|uniref:PhzF family phenazine biosynthesis protein n=1 Tax=uncultured Paraglaciecola sp. TaxID=1765024 RepID=UPI002625ABBE|nr:PhzF family phenazine biosynthesis protein [uncultured Paraglaciecola sp.]
MDIKIYQVDAFASKVFEGNPAAVCPLDSWLCDDILQKIAQENNLSETAFFVPNGQGFHLRWFTPKEEVELCGHATLAAAHVLFQHLNFTHNTIEFMTLSGKLAVSRVASGYSMSFPASVATPLEPSVLLQQGLGVTPKQVLKAFDYIVVLENEAQVKTITPDYSKLQQLDLRGVVVTAPGDEVDFVSRCFFPKLDVNEDPVTGSAHCELAPFWAKMFNRTNLVGKQLSQRTGIVNCQVQDKRVILLGQAVDYMTGTITINESI